MSTFENFGAVQKSGNVIESLSQDAFKSMAESPKVDLSDSTYLDCGWGKSMENSEERARSSVNSARDSEVLNNNSADSVSRGADSVLPKLYIDCGWGRTMNDSNLPYVGLVQTVSDRQSNILDTASDGVGRKVWKESPYADITQNGENACAAALSIILADAGYEYVDSPLVSGLIEQLVENGWTIRRYSQRQSGDVLVRHAEGQDWKAGGGKAHIGIVGDDINTVYHNKSSTGVWSHTGIKPSFGHGVRFVVRPPESEHEQIRSRDVLRNTDS